MLPNNDVFKTPKQFLFLFLVLELQNTSSRFVQRLPSLLLGWLKKPVLRGAHATFILLLSGYGRDFIHGKQHP